MDLNKIRSYLKETRDPQNGLEDSSGRTPTIVDDALDYLNRILPDGECGEFLKQFEQLLEVLQEVHEEILPEEEEDLSTL